MFAAGALKSGPRYPVSIVGMRQKEPYFFHSVRDPLKYDNFLARDEVPIDVIGIFRDQKAASARNFKDPCLDLAASLGPQSLHDDPGISEIQAHD